MILKYKIALLIISSVVVIGVAVGVTVGVVASNDNTKEGREFTIDHVRNTFLKDGEPFRYIAGSFHYFRARPETWRSKFRTMRAAGLNAVDLYVQWSLHNPRDGVYDFEGIANIEGVIEAAIAEDLLVILRPGPYICAEIDNGGVPYWLFTKYPGIRLRTDDQNYLNEVEIWYEHLMGPLEKYMYGNDGPIIMVQIENEYGASEICNKPYLNFLKNQTERYTQGKALLFTVDRPIGNELECGQIEDVFVTTDFGLSTDAEVDAYWAKLREVQPTGPLTNTEFYTGWLTHWQEENARRDAGPLAQTLKKMLSDGANVDFYMFFGGTNFGFWAGANDWGLGKYMADITSYDYDAPMDEAGDPTDKYRAFREIIAQYIEMPEGLEVPANTLKMALPSINVRPLGTLLSTKGRSSLGTAQTQHQNAPTFEELNQNSGFVLYETTLPKFTRDPSELVINDLRDRAYIYVDEFFVGILSRENAIKSLPVSSGLGTTLQILVENQGRINFQVADDYKGILGNVTLQMWLEPYYQELTGWRVTGYPLENYTDVENYLTAANTDTYVLPKNGVLTEGPVVFHAEFQVTVPEIYDTYFDTTNWGKGIMYVNGVHIGRYWPLAGPQMTMYIPKDLLKSGTNVIVIIEYQKAPLNGLVRFTDTPQLD